MTAIYLILNFISIIFLVDGQQNENDDLGENLEKAYNNQDYDLYGLLKARNALDFTGKVALVTGSNSGIGAETVRLLSLLGAQVVVTGRNTTRIRQVAQQCCQLSPKKLKVKSFLSYFQ